MVKELPVKPGRLLVGPWIRDHLSEGPDYMSHAHLLYKQETGKNKMHGMSYSSFTKYFYFLTRLGFIERTGKTEPSPEHSDLAHPEHSSTTTVDTTEQARMEHARVFYRITPRGRKVSAYNWTDPITTLYSYEPKQRRGR